MNNEANFDIAEITANVVKNSCNSSDMCPFEKFPKNASVTMAYVPFQLDRTTYNPYEALKNGTLFITLNKPFFGGKCHE